MNKVKIGKYLKQLRENNSLSRTEAANQLGTIYKSVLDWEKGVMPSNESLLELAKLYKVTVDDILECGKQITIEELYKKYPDFQPLYLRSREESVVFYSNYDERQFEIWSKFKELIMLFRQRILSRSEDLELRFLFNNISGFSDYYYKNHNDDHKDKYLCFIKVLNDAKAFHKTAPEYYFEVRKSILIKQLRDPFPEYGVPDFQPLKDKMFKSLENWEKDFYLALMQNSDAIINLPYTPSLLKDYEERYGEQFDKEKIIKRLMKYFINNGAELNPWLFSFIQKNKIEHNVLSTLEELYLDYVKPIFIYFYDLDDEEYKEYKYAHVDNNDENRFLDNYSRYYLPVSKTDSVNPKQILDLLINADEKTIVNYLYSIRRFHKEVEETEYRFKKADVEYELESFYKCREKLLQDRKIAAKGINQIRELEEKLKNGELVFYEYELEDISKEKGFDHWSLMTMWKNQLSYFQFLKKRNHKMTTELMGEIDNLSLEEIRNKYFKKEVVE